MNRYFPIGFLGGCGPHEIVVRMTPEEIRTRLKMILRDEDFMEAMLSTQLHYTGEIMEASFTMRACKQPRGTQRPTLLAELEPTERGTRIRFRIEPQAWMLYYLLLMFVFMMAVMVFFMVASGLIFPFCFMPIIGPVIFILNSMFTRVWSGRVLRFFLELFEADRIA